MKCPWTADEVQFLTDNYPKYGGEYCLRHLPSKTLSSIHNKVFQLKLKYVSQSIEGHKICKKCFIEKPFDRFVKHRSKRFGLDDTCKECVAEKGRIFRDENKEKIRREKQEYYFSNKEHIQRRIIKNTKRRLACDPTFRMITRVRKRFRDIFKTKSFSKYKEKIIGCTASFLREHIEAQFTSEMTWENYGKYNGELNHGWDIDHITPISSAKTEEDVIRLNHYSNLRPLCSYTNRCVKKDNIITVNKVGNISALSIK